MYLMVIEISKSSALNEKIYVLGFEGSSIITYKVFMCLVDNQQNPHSHGRILRKAKTGLASLKFTIAVREEPLGVVNCNER
jgi:hypothetical protein